MHAEGEVAQPESIRNLQRKGGSGIAKRTGLTDGQCAVGAIALDGSGLAAGKIRARIGHRRGTVAKLSAGVSPRLAACIEISRNCSQCRGRGIGSDRPAGRQAVADGVKVLGVIGAADL